MSFFKTLQSIPGVITIFHSTKNASSKELLRILNKHQVSKEPVTEGKSWFSKYLSLSSSDAGNATKELDEILNKDGVDVSNDYKNSLYYIDTQSKFPTIQQFKLIHQYAANKKEPHNKTTFSAVFPKFSAEDNASGVIKNPDSTILKELASKPLEEISTDVFKPPLVIDWLKGLIRNTPEGVEEIVLHYK